MAIDFRPRYKDYAVFTPAVSEMYVRFEGNKNPKRPMPAGLAQSDLDFLKEDCPIYHIPYALYSAGQAAKTAKVAARKDMISMRDRDNTTIIGDSGGFQIQTNAIKFKGDDTRNRMMNWLQDNCDWSMILDFPTGGINIGNVDHHTDRLNEELLATPYVYEHLGHKYTIKSVEDFCKVIGYDRTDIQKIGFATCLLQTIINNDYFVANRKPVGTPGATNFLNVVQGRNVEESNIWYEHVKKFPFDAWSLASHHKENFVMTMTRMIDMWHDGLLENKDWMHILGVGKLANGCVYTTMQRCIREHANPNFTLSYDVSSPFTTTAFGNLFMGYTLDKSGWTIQSGWVDGHEYLPGGPKANIPFLEELRKVYDKKNLINIEDGGNSRFIETEIGKRLKMGDICVNTDPELTSTWDVVTYAVLMNHNLQVHLTGVFEAQDLYDKGDKEHVPHGLLRFQEIIPEIFHCGATKGRDEAHKLIRKYRKDLNYLAGDVATAGVPDYTDFDMSSISSHKAFHKAKSEKTTVALKEVDSGLFDDVG